MRALERCPLNAKKKRYTKKYLKWGYLKHT